MFDTGKYSDPHRLHVEIDSYEVIRKDFAKARRYYDVSYIDGYITGLHYPLVWLKSRLPLPPYYIFGYGRIVTQREYRRLLPKASRIHRGASRFAERVVQRHGLDRGGLTFHHIPFLIERDYGCGFPIVSAPLHSIDDLTRPA